MKKHALVFLLLFFFVSVGFMAQTYFLATARIPAGRSRAPETSALWISKSEMGVHQLVLKGTPYERGFQSGRTTAPLLVKQEKEMLQIFENLFPSRFLRELGLLAARRWFYPLEDHLTQAEREEIYGVSAWAPHLGDSYADPFTRQIAYHGLHEVGQMMVDSGIVTETTAGACSVFLVPRQEKAWVIGRNFDFEAGRIFDEEKILKWIFPSEGYAYASLSFAGFTGVVSGINQHGVFIALNAAGSDDFRRVGAPTSLIAARALQFSKTAEEAVQMISSTESFITDIFTVVDAFGGKAFRVEKTPRKTAVDEIKTADVITNHLQNPLFKEDRTNQSRIRMQTTWSRFNRGQELLKLNAAKWNQPISSEQLSLQVLSFLRDKSALGGAKLPFYHRSAIDALIATHSLVVDGEKKILYVSEGPSLVGSFKGFDLEKSFALQKPVASSRDLPADPQLSKEDYARIHLEARRLEEVRRNIQKGNCALSAQFLNQFDGLKAESYYTALGEAYECMHQDDKARESFALALQNEPAYLKDRESLERKLKR